MAEPTTVVCACVCTRPQKADLDRQIERLSTLYLGALLVKEVGGELNFRRRGLVGLLGRVLFACQPNQACAQKY